MKCSPKTMLKIGLVLGGIIVIGAIAFPQFRPAIIGLAPFILFAICPISMIFMASAMNKGKDHSDSCTSCGHQHVEQHLKSHE